MFPNVIGIQFLSKATSEAELVILFEINFHIIKYYFKSYYSRSFYFLI